MLFQIFHCLLNRARYILLLDGEFGRENHKIEKQSVNGMGGPQISVKAWGIIAFQNLFQIARKPTGCFFVKHKLPHFFIFCLGEDFSIETAVVFGELYKNGDEWKFNAIGSGYQGGLAALCNSYGVDVE